MISKPKALYVTSQSCQGTQNHLKALASFLVLLFWISSWFPASAGKWAIFVAAGCILGLIAAHLARKPPGELVWPAKATLALAFVLLIGGPLLALRAWAKGTSVDGGLTLFFVLGFVGYLFMISRILTPGQTLGRYRHAGLVVLFLIAIWSWASAISMYSHRGANRYTKNACILVPKPTEYDTKLSSIWEMRLPQIASRTTSPNGRYIWSYHAILVAQIDGGTEHYNWSKKWMRFEILDAERNPYLPTKCP